MLQLRGYIDGIGRTFVLDRPETSIGRGDDNDIVLTDRVTSRHHARIVHHADRWWIRDEASRYGTRVNGDVADETELELGDVVTIGTVDLTVEQAADAHEDSGAWVGNEPDGEATPISPLKVDPDDELLLSADDPDDDAGHSLDGVDDSPVIELVRPIVDFASSLGLTDGEERTDRGTVVEATEHTPVGDAHGYSGLAVGYLSRLAHELRTAPDIDEAARRTLEVVFAALPVERGWILFTDPDGRVIDRLERIGDTVAHPEGDLPISMSIVRQVVRDRVSVSTGDADLALGSTSESMRVHHIRDAMCAPLWSGDQVSGVIYVDTVLGQGGFTESALDLLTTMANYAAVAVAGLRYAQAAEHERKARRHLERYHSPAMIDALQRKEAVEGMSKLRQADVTVLFADVVGFAAVSEQLTPDGVARLLDGFFTEAVEAVFAHGGTLDKFIGDAVMAFFGAPVAAHDHAEQALRAALDLRHRVNRWNAAQVESGGRPVEIRLALNSGPVVVGDVGSSRRVDYTVLGNTVNIAARLEGVGGPGEIVVGPGTRQRLPADFPLESLGEVDLKGLRHPVPVWRVATQPA